MKIRQGRHRKENIYVQLSDEPSDDDEWLGVIPDVKRGELIVDVMNEYFAGRNDR
jgi:hypothetical protein